MHYLYKITNNFDNKIYIGQTNHPELRWQQHKSKARSDEVADQVICRAMRKYGIDNFKMEIIMTCETLEEINELEIKYIKDCESLVPNGYNVSAGGGKLNDTPEIRARISESLKRFYKNNPNPNKGRVVSEETRKKQSEKAMGNTNSKGRVLTDIHKQRIAAANTGKKASEEARKNISLGHMGQRPPNRKLTSEQAKQVRQDRRDGMTIVDIAKKYKMAKNTLIAILGGFTYREPEAQIDPPKTQEAIEEIKKEEISNIVTELVIDSTEVNKN